MNIPDSDIVKMLKKDFNNLIKFVQRIDGMVNDPAKLKVLWIQKLQIDKNKFARKNNGKYVNSNN